MHCLLDGAVGISSLRTNYRAEQITSFRALASAAEYWINFTHLRSSLNGLLPPDSVMNKIHPLIIAAAISCLEPSTAQELADELITLSRRLGISEFSGLPTSEEIELNDKMKKEEKLKLAKSELGRHGIVPARVREGNESKPWTFVSTIGRQKLNTELINLIDLFGHGHFGDGDHIEDCKNNPDSAVTVYEVI